jgi:hypothetical protein
MRHGYTDIVGGLLGAKTKFGVIGEKEKNDENTIEVNRGGHAVVPAVASQLVSPGGIAV